MALNRSKNYGTRWETSSEESPQGKFKDKSSETAVDGSYIQKSWINDISDGWNGAILKGYVPTQEQLDAVNPLGFNNNAGIIGTPVNEIVDKANESQVYNAWYKHTQELADGRIADKQIEEKIAALETLTEGCWFTYYSGGKYKEGGQEAVTGSDGGDNAPLVDFNFNNSASGGATKTINKNNITVSADGFELTFLKAGMYAVKPVFFVTSSTNFASEFQFQINKPSVGSYEDYIGKTNISLYAMHFETGSGVNTQFNPTRSGAIDISDTVVSTTTFSQYLAFGTSQNDFMIAVEEDNTKLKLQTKIFDNDGVSPSYFNFQLSLFRIGKYISDYDLPTDIVVAPS